MKGERLERIESVVEKEKVWPVYFVVTDAGAYEYAARAFIKRQELPRVHQLVMPRECDGQVIVDARGDGESAVLLLENGFTVVFELALDPFGKELRSWPIVRFETPDQSLVWRHEFIDMEPILIIQS